MHLWSNTNIKWKNANWTWSEIALVTEIAKIGGGGYIPIEEHFKKDLKKKKKFIRILCKINGTNFDEIKEVKDMKISVKDIKLVIKNVLNIDLNISDEFIGVR